MITKWVFGLLSKFGAFVMIAAIAWLGWQHLGPRKPDVSELRKDSAESAAALIAEDIRQNRGELHDVVMLHFGNDPSDYFTDTLRRRIELHGILDLRDLSFLEKVRRKLNLRIPATESAREAVKKVQKLDADGALFGTVHTFEHHPEGVNIDVDYLLVAADGSEVYSGRYSTQEARTAAAGAGEMRPSKTAEWVQRGLVWLMLVLLLPVFSISFIRNMVRKRSNPQNAFVLGIYTVTDAILAWFMIGGAFTGIWSVLLLLAAVILAMLYNIRIMGFAVQLEDA